MLNVRILLKYNVRVFVIFVQVAQSFENGQKGACKRLVFVLFYICRKGKGKPAGQTANLEN